eukprot:scaffold4230_cov94-Cylindrotheca_fusiformis.AAC.1
MSNCIDNNNENNNHNINTIGKQPEQKKKKTKYKGIQNGWFTETASIWPGQKFSLALEDDFVIFSSHDRLTSSPPRLVRISQKIPSCTIIDRNIKIY